MFSQRPAINDLAFHIAVPHTPHHQFDQAVGKQDTRLALHLLRQVLKCCGDERGRTQNVPGRDGDLGSGLKQHGSTSFQPSSAHLRSLQVLQNADRAIFPLRSPAQALNVAGVLVMRAVGEIQPCDIHSQAHQIAHRCF